MPLDRRGRAKECPIVKKGFAILLANAEALRPISFNALEILHGQQLIGERSCQNVVTQTFRRGRQPRPKAMLFQFAGRSKDAGALHEQRAQIAIATLADAAKDRPIARRHLPLSLGEGGG